MDPSSIWLKEDFGQRAFFPTDDSFDADLCNTDSVTVEGSPLHAQQSSSSPVVLTPLSPFPASNTAQSVSETSSGSRPIFSKKVSSATVKVIKATLKRIPAERQSLTYNNRRLSLLVNRMLMSTLSKVLCNRSGEENIY